MIDFKLVFFGIVVIGIFVFGLVGHSSGEDSAPCVSESDCLGVGHLGFGMQGVVLIV